MEESSTTVYEPGYEPQKLFWSLAWELEVIHRDVHSKMTDWKPDQVLTAVEDHPEVAVERLFLGYIGGSPVEIVARLTSEGKQECLLLLCGHLPIGMNFACEDKDDLQWYVKVVTAGIPDLIPPEVPEEKIFMSFSYDSSFGPQATQRAIDAPRWEDIRSNYSRGAREQLESLLGTEPEDFSGHLGILHGVPGSGKTTFLRALARAWKGKADFTYVVDPETLFNDPGYLLKILLEKSHGAKWQVVICEDAEEFIAPGAKAEVGQALSRVLNLGDGMLGQGLKVLFLFTTNKPDGELAPAITRPGRCFATLEIPAFSAMEAAKWLGEHECSNRRMVIEGEKTLAELYQILRSQ